MRLRRIKFNGVPDEQRPQCDANHPEK